MNAEEIVADARVLLAKYAERSCWAGEAWVEVERDLRLLIDRAEGRA